MPDAMPEAMEGVGRSPGRGSDASPGRFGGRHASSMTWTRGGRGRRGGNASRGRKSNAMVIDEPHLASRNVRTSVGSGRGGPSREKKQWKLGKAMDTEEPEDRKESRGFRGPPVRREREEGEMMDLNDPHPTSDKWKGSGIARKQKSTHLQTKETEPPKPTPKFTMGGPEAATVETGNNENVRISEERGNVTAQARIFHANRTQDPMLLKPTAETEQARESFDPPAVLDARAARFKKTLQGDADLATIREGYPRSTTAPLEKTLFESEEEGFEMEGDGSTFPADRQDTGTRQGPIVGSCEDMCPRSERERRERLDDIHFFERVEAGDRSRTSKELAVKRFSRQVDNPPAEDVRTRKALQRTMVHLRRLLLWADMKGADASTRASRLATVHKFLWDRYRGVRSDLTVQGIRDGFAIHLLEEMVRFHIMAEHELCEAGEAQIDDHEGFNRHLNVEQLNKCLITLNEFYSDAWSRSDSNHVHSGGWVTGKDVPPECRNEPEFRAYHLLTQLGTHGKYKQNMSQVVRDLSSLPPYSLRTPPIELALRMLSLMGIGDYVGFFRSMREEQMPYLAACCAFMVSGSARSKALKVLYSTGCRGESFPIQRLQELLLFDTFDQAVTLCKHHGLIPANCDGKVQNITLNKEMFIEPSQSFPAFLSGVIQEKRANIPLADIIKNPGWNYVSRSPERNVTACTPTQPQLSQDASKPPHMPAPEKRKSLNQGAAIFPGNAIPSKNHKRQQDPTEGSTRTEPPHKRRRDVRSTPVDVEPVQHIQLPEPAEHPQDGQVARTVSIAEVEKGKKLEEERQMAERLAQAQARARLERGLEMEKKWEAAEREKEKARKAQAAQKAEAAARAAAARAAAAEEERLRKEAKRKEKCRKSILQFRLHQWREVTSSIIDARRVAARHKASMQACSADPSLAVDESWKVLHRRSGAATASNDQIQSGLETEFRSGFYWTPLKIGHIVTPHLRKKGMCIGQGITPWKVLVSCPQQKSFSEEAMESHFKLDRHVCDWLWCKLGGYPCTQEGLQAEFTGLKYSHHFQLSKLGSDTDLPTDRHQDGRRMHAPDKELYKIGDHALYNDNVQKTGDKCAIDFSFTAVDVGSSSFTEELHLGCCAGIFLMSSAAVQGSETAIGEDNSRMATLLNLFRCTSQHLPIMVVLPPAPGGSEDLRLWRRRMHSAVYIALGLDRLPSSPVNIVALPPGIISAVSCQKIERGIDWLASCTPAPPSWSFVHPYDFIVQKLDMVTCGTPQEYVQTYNAAVAELVREVNSTDVLALEQWGWPSDPEIRFFPDESVREKLPLSSRIANRRHELTSMLQRLYAEDLEEKSHESSVKVLGTSRQGHGTVMRSCTWTTSSQEGTWQHDIQQLVYELLVPLATAPYVMLAHHCTSTIDSATLRNDEFVPRSPAYIMEQYEQSASTGSLLSVALAQSERGAIRQYTLAGTKPKNLEEDFLCKSAQAHVESEAAPSTSNKSNSFGFTQVGQNTVEQLQSALKSEIQKEREFEDMLVYLAAAAPEF